jgi:hypothetical protein
MTRTTASSRKTIAVAFVALAITLGALTISTLHAVTAPAYASGLSLARNSTNFIKALRS